MNRTNLVSLCIAASLVAAFGCSKRIPTPLAPPSQEAPAPSAAGGKERPLKVDFTSAVGRSLEETGAPVRLVTWRRTEDDDCALHGYARVDDHGVPLNENVAWFEYSCDSAPTTCDRPSSPEPGLQCILESCCDVLESCEDDPLCASISACARKCDGDAACGQRCAWNGDMAAERKFRQLIGCASYKC